jgi:hypothetical protein
MPDRLAADFDAVDYLHCFADDAYGCAISASKTIHAIADELGRMEVDLTVAVAEAQRARAESATNREAGGAWRDRALTVEAQRQAVLDLCDQAEYDARTERELGSGLDGSGVVWIGDIRAALEATREGNV